MNRDPEARLVVRDWMDREDRVIDIEDYDGETLFSQFLPPGDEGLEVVDHVRREARAMLAWVDYVERVGG